MNCIAVDDEILALKGMERVIKKALPDSSLSCFDAPEDALAYAKENRVDVAFLDVEMGGMNGLELAKALKDIDGKTNIVFATGHSQYALDSYSVNASDYLLKPVTEEAVAKAVERLRDPVAIKTDKKVRVQTFGSFAVFVNDAPLSFSRAKAKELFAFLIDRQGAPVTTAEIAATLWEDKPYNASIKNQAQTVISELIKTLTDNGVEDVIVKSWNQVSIDRSKISCDYYDLQHWDLNAVNAYRGEYMTNYSWAEMTTAALSQKTNIA